MSGVRVGLTLVEREKSVRSRDCRRCVLTLPARQNKAVHVVKLHAMQSVLNRERLLTEVRGVYVCVYRLLMRDAL